jgi:hypothetical protein
LHDLAADVLLEGSVNVEAGRVRATVHLVDAATGYDIWSIALDEVEGSAAALQQRLAERIAARLPLTSVKSIPSRSAAAVSTGNAHFAQLLDAPAAESSTFDGT